MNVRNGEKSHLTPSELQKAEKSQKKTEGKNNKEQKSMTLKTEYQQIKWMRSKPAFGERVNKTLATLSKDFWKEKMEITNLRDKRGDFLKMPADFTRAQSALLWIIL